MPYISSSGSPWHLAYDAGVPQFRAAREYLARHEAGRSPLKSFPATRPMLSPLAAGTGYRAPPNSLASLDCTGDTYLPRRRRPKNARKPKGATLRRSPSPVSAAGVTPTAATYTAWSPFEGSICTSNGSSDFGNTGGSNSKGNVGALTAAADPITGTPSFSSSGGPIPTEGARGGREASCGLLGDDAAVCLANVSRSIDNLIKESLQRPAQRPASGAAPYMQRKTHMGRPMEPTVVPRGSP